MTKNPKAVWAFLTALAALGVLCAGLLVPHYSGDVGLYEAIPAVPVGLILAFVSLRLARGARFEHQRSLGRSGGARLATAARLIGGVAFLLAITGALALGVFAALTLASR